MLLSELKAGQSARIVSVGGHGSLRQHLLDMGLVPGAVLTLTQFAPQGDPMQIRVHSYELSLRLEDAAQIEVAVLSAEELARFEARTRAESLPFDERSIHDGVPHPGLGEGGPYHNSKTENPLPKGAPISIALAGNQNSGKTTLFNAITGSDQHVGNFPGVTVEHKTASLIEHPDITVIDLPGIYSLSPYSSEELISRDFIIDEQPSCIIDVVDASNLERNLYLTIQLMELGRPMVLALNMMDEVRNNGGVLLVNELEKLLGIPVVPIAAAKNEGIDELIDHVLHVAHFQEKPKRHDFCPADDEQGEAVHRAIHSIMPFIKQPAQENHLPLRFAAEKLIEGDPAVASSLQLDPDEVAVIDGIIRTMEDEGGLDRTAAIASMRYRFIHEVVQKVYRRPDEIKEHSLSRRIDRFLTGKYTAVPFFILIMCLVFWLTFEVIGGPLQDLLASGIEWLGAQVASSMDSAGVHPLFSSLITDGVFKGLGAVLSFLPLIVTLFFFLSLLEDSGYMARVAFVADKSFRKLGLSGRSIVPMIIGFGCTVPAVMATRTLPSERDRKITILLTPFMSCSAKLPIYAFFSQAFFPEHATLVMISLYLLGILISFLVALITKRVYPGQPVPFVLELPNYRFPSAKNVLRLMAFQAGSFIKRAFTVIFIGSLIIWFLSVFDPRMHFTTNADQSLLALLSGWIAVIFRPMGYGDWRFVSALLAGFMAKENVVSILNILFGSVEAIMASLTTASAFSFLVFCLLYTPCIAAVQAVSREIGKKNALYLVLFQCGVAWLASFLTYQVFVLFG